MNAANTAATSGGNANGGAGIAITNSTIIIIVMRTKA